MTPRSVVSNVSTGSPLDVPQGAEMNTLAIQPEFPFLVIATNPDNAGHDVGLVVRAISSDEAKRAAREKLAVDRRDHWELRIAQKCRSAMCTEEAEIESGDFGKVCSRCMRSIEDTVGT